MKYFYCNMDQTRNVVILICSAAFLLFLGANGQSIKITNLQSDTFCSEGLVASNNILLIEGEADLNGDAQLSRYIMIDIYFSSDSTNALSVCAMETKSPIDNPSCAYNTTEKDNIYRFFVKLPATATLSQGKISAYLLYKNATKIAAEINLPGIYNPDSTNVNLKINDKIAIDKEIITLNSDVIKLEAACSGSLKPCKLQLEFNDTASKVEDQSLLKYEKKHQAQSAVLVTLTVTVCHENVFRKSYSYEIILGTSGLDTTNEQIIIIIAVTIPVTCLVIVTIILALKRKIIMKKCKPIPDDWDTESCKDSKTTHQNCDVAEIQQDKSLLMDIVKTVLPMELNYQVIPDTEQDTEELEGQHLLFKQNGQAETYDLNNKQEAVPKVNSEAQEYASFDRLVNNDKYGESDSGSSMGLYAVDNSKELDLKNDGSGDSKGPDDKPSECLRESPHGEAPAVGYSNTVVQEDIDESDAPFHECVSEMQYSSEDSKEIPETKELNYQVIPDTEQDTEELKLLQTATNSEDTSCIEV